MDPIQTGIDLLYYFAISAGIGVPLVFCAYMVMMPTQRICATWQNYRVSRSPHRALKDRHFRHLPGRVRMLKIVCFFGFFVFLWLALQQFHVDLAGMVSRFTK